MDMKDYSGGFGRKHAVGNFDKIWQFDPMFNNGVLNEILYSINNTQNSLQISGGFSPYNGTTIKIYKL